MQENENKVRIILADDHNVVRKGFRALLDAEADFSVVGEAADGLAAVRLVERLEPDVLVVDLAMPGLSGLDVVWQVSRSLARTRAIVLSMYSSEAYVREALRNGAIGYVLKDSGVEHLVQAIREVAAGRHYLAPPLSELIVEAYLKKVGESSLDIYQTLTIREREVLQLTAEGYTSAQVGSRLFISPRTVEIHRAHLMQKLSLKNQVDLIRYALKRGILPIEEFKKTEEGKQRSEKAQKKPRPKQGK